MDFSKSINGVPIRLTKERWDHIVLNKPYMRSYYNEVLETVSNPTFILQGYSGTLVRVLPPRRRKYLNVVYREISKKDGFIITAFISRKVNRSLILWPKKS